jgi:large subunit ribosomal protein L10
MIRRALNAGLQMKLTKQQKKEISKQMAGVLKKAPHLYFTHYQGLKFLELAELRKKLKPLGCKYQVVKNSLVEYALKDSGISGSTEGMLKGPVGLVVGEGTDPVAAVKVLATFAREFPKLKIRAGYVEGQWLDVSGCARLATLGTKPDLLAMLAGTLYSAVAQAAGVLQAPIRDLALTIKALEEKKQKDGAVPAAA